MKTTWLTKLHDDEEAARQAIANATDEHPEIVELIQGSTWEQIYKMPEIQALFN